MKRGVQIRVSSEVEKKSLDALRDLLYLHPHQPRDEEGILRALREYGHPRIREVEDALRICVGDVMPQSLFAYDEADPEGHPVGVVIFSRPDSETLGIVHIAVHPDYAMHGLYSDLGLGVLLIERVRALARRVAGVKRIKLYYRRNVELPV